LTILVGEIIFYLEEKDAFNIAKIVDIPLNDFKSNEKLILFLTKVEQCEEPELFQIFKIFHDQENFYSLNFNIVIDFLLITKNVEFVKVYYKFEMKYHDENELNLYKCVKFHLGTSKKTFWFLKLGKMLQSEKTKIHNVKSQLLRFGPIKKLLKVKNIKSVSVTTQNYLLTGIQIVFYFTDLIKDLFLIITIARFVPFSLSSLDSFGFQIFFLLLLSIILPECINAVTMLTSNDLSVCKNSAKIYLACLPPILSALSLYISSRYKSKKDLMYQKKDKNLDDFLSNFQTLRKRLMYLEEKENYWHDISVRMRRNENVFEHTLQVIVLIIFTAPRKATLCHGLENFYCNCLLFFQLSLGLVLSFYFLLHHLACLTS